MMQPGLALARLDDASLIAAMSSRLIEAGLAPSWPAERVARHIRHAESVVLAARSSGRVVGFAIMQFGDTSAHLNLLAGVCRLCRYKADLVSMDAALVF